MSNDFLSETDTRAVNEIVSEVLQIAEEQIAAEAVIDDLGSDSLHRIEIAMEVEDQFDLSIPDQEWEKVRTVGDLYELISKSLAMRR